MRKAALKSAAADEVYNGKAPDIFRFQGFSLANVATLDTKGDIATVIAFWLMVTLVNSKREAGEWIARLRGE